MYDVLTHAISSWVADRFPAMRGSATLMIVVSRISIIAAVINPSRMNHRKRSTCSACAALAAAAARAFSEFGIAMKNSEAVYGRAAYGSALTNTALVPSEYIPYAANTPVGGIVREARIAPGARATRVRVP